jgi:hypothetical protein
MKAFQPGFAVRRAGRTPAKIVDVAQAGKELNRIVHAVHAKLER